MTGNTQINGDAHMNVSRLPAPERILHTKPLADIEGHAEEKPTHTAAEDRQARVVLRTRFERPLLYLGLIAPGLLLVVLWFLGVV